MLTGSSNSVGLGIGPGICASKDTEVMLILWVQRPHFENYRLGVLIITLKSVLPQHFHFPSPLLASHGLLNQAQTQQGFGDIYHAAPNLPFLFISKLSFPWYLMLQQTEHFAVIEHGQILSTFLHLYCYSNLPRNPFSLSPYFNHSRLSTNAPSE